MLNWVISEVISQSQGKSDAGSGRFQRAAATFGGRLWQRQQYQLQALALNPSHVPPAADTKRGTSY